MDIAGQKRRIRKEMRKARLEHAETLAPEASALIFFRPPAPLLRLIPENAIIGLYRADPGEAPAGSYARFFFDRNHQIALPWLVGLDHPMRFRAHTDPYSESDLEEGFYGLMQPGESAEEVTPDVLFMPLVAFTPTGDRLGQGGGFYDKWLGAHPDTIRIGMAWDIQEVNELPIEPHDMALTAIVTPTRIIGPF